LQHRRRAFRHFLRRLRRNDEVEVLLVRIVPAVGIVRLERGGVARLRGVIAANAVCRASPAKTQMPSPITMMTASESKDREQLYSGGDQR